MSQRQKNNNKNKNLSKKKKSLEDYVFYIGTNKQASDFELTRKYILNHIKKTYAYGHDVSESLRTHIKIDVNSQRPTLKVSTKTDTEEKKAEEEQFKLEYKAELDECMRREKKYEANMYKAYAKMWERCSRSMKSKIEARVDYETNIYDNPINLLQAIKEHSLQYEETRYEMKIIVDAFENYFNCKQKESKSLQDYTKRFKVSRDVLNSHLGGVIRLHKIVENDDSYADASQEDKMKIEKDADERLSTYLYLKNADQAKYGSILKGLNAQKSLKNDQYPKSLIDGNNALSNHPWDNKNSNNKKNQKNKMMSINKNQSQQKYYHYNFEHHNQQ